MPVRLLRNGVRQAEDANGGRSCRERGTTDGIRRRGEEPPPNWTAAFRARRLPVSRTVAISGDMSFLFVDL